MSDHGAALVALNEGAAPLDPVGLDHVLQVAALQSRVDRKYLVPPLVFKRLVHDCASDLKVLEIGGLREFRYESIYFDTAELASYHQAATGRRSRFKVRTRTYLDSRASMLEVKTRGGRGETVKARMMYTFDHRGHLDVSALGFVEERVNVPDGAAGLVPVLSTTYHRTTLVDPVAGTRMTCDAQLRCSSPRGLEVALEVAMDDHVIVETKSPGPATRADRLLWAMGERPTSISKYCVGLALLDPGLPANKWNRTLRRHFGWTPQRQPAVGW